MLKKSLKSTLSVFALALFLVVPALQANEATPDEEVAGLEKMCKESGPAMQKRQAEKSLYLRLGGETRIRTLSTLIYAAHHRNPAFGDMLKYVESEPFVENVAMFLVTGTGGEGKYEGKNMKDAHSHLNMTNSDFLAAGVDVTNSMKELGHGENEIQEVICSLVSFIPDVVIK